MMVKSHWIAAFKIKSVTAHVGDMIILNYDENIWKCAHLKCSLSSHIYLLLLDVMGNFNITEEQEWKIMKEFSWQHHPAFIETM